MAGERLNGTLTRVGALLAREREFLADAAHELRTPLAVITAQADVLMRTTESAARAEAARQLGSGLERTSRLVGQLLALARLEAGVDRGDTGGTGAAPAVSDLVEVVREALAAHVPAAAARGIDLSYVGPDSAPLPLAAPLLHSIVDNLVANAVRYIHDDGRVVVQVRAVDPGTTPDPGDAGSAVEQARPAGGPGAAVSPSEDQASNGPRQGESSVGAPATTWVLEVLDDGPGIPGHERARVFERFHRVGGVRASGSGLGLAIVAAAARVARARVGLDDGLEGKGLRVSVRFANMGGPSR